MKTRHPLNHLDVSTLLALLALSSILYPPSISAQGTAFTYQGRLSDNGAPANGAYNLRLTLYDASILGNVLGVGPLTNAPVAVSNGLFTVLLDFGPGVFTGSPVWLQMDVSSNTVAPAYVSLSTRQQLTPAPYAIYSENSGAANSVNTNGVSAAGLNTLGAPSSGQVLSYVGGNLVWTTPSAGGGGGGWSLTGNDGAGAFLGTTNNYPLRLAANSLGAALFWPFANGSVSVSLGTYNYFSTLGNGGDFIAGGGNSGAPNFIYTDNSSIGGGYDNQINASSPESVIAGGNGHRITGGSGVIGGGSFNTISNYASVGTIPGGANNLVAGDYGFAAGNGAQALHPGAFVWADNSGGAFGSTSNNQFSVRALGGVRFLTGGAGMTIDGLAVGSGGGGGGGTNWSVNGNSGFSPTNGNFLGTTDNQPLEIHAYGQQAFRLEPDNSGSGAPNVIGGSSNLVVIGGYGDVIAGGQFNTINGIDSTIGGGNYNTSGAGGTGYETVAGGGFNQATSSYATVSGGAGNTSSGSSATVGGGLGNTAGGLYAVVPGGFENTAGGDYSFAAGREAQAVNQGAFVWADSQNALFPSTADDQFSVRAQGGVRFFTQSGSRNMILDGYRVLTTADGGGGGGNTNDWSLTGNAGADPASGYFLGTTDNNALELRVNNTRAFRLEPGPGFINLPNVIGGSSANSVAAGHFAAAIGGGSLNTISANFATVSGGFGNTNSGDYATVGGGFENTASGIGSFVGGGGFDGTNANGNTASGNAATVGGGFGNQAIGPYSTAPGGYNNQAYGPYSFACGYHNQANGAYSFAGGHNALANNDGSFVWSDSTGEFGVDHPDSFNVKASGGVTFIAGDANLSFASGAGSFNVGSGCSLMLDAGFGITSLQAGSASLACNTSGEVDLTAPSGVVISTSGQVDLTAPTGVVISDNTPSISFGSTTRQMINLYGSKYGIGVQDADEYFRTGNEFWWYLNGSHINTGGNPGPGGTTLMRLANNGNLTIAGTLIQNSDRNVKTNVAAVDARGVLERVAAMSMAMWTYKTEAPTTRHLGPMAQDFYAAFGLGEDDRHITTVDEGGVALAAIQGLNQKLEAQRSQLEQKQTEITELKQRLERLEQLMTQRIGGAK